MKKIKKKNSYGQITLEFTFAMVVALIMLYGILKIFIWAGYDFGWRRIDHDQLLISNINEDFNGTCLRSVGGNCVEWDVEEGPIEQIDPYFHRPEKMNATWGL